MSERIVAIAATTDIVVATTWRELLAAEGIHAELGGTDTATSVCVMMPWLGAIDVFVTEAYVARARALIDAAQGTGEDPDSPGGPDARTTL